jgi:glycosyltransferase involved in cell wall biosynthesis
MVKISLVIPVYYNAPSLPLLNERLNLLASRLPQYIFEFIYVDDGSGDDSYTVIKTLAHKDPRIKVVRLVRNFGSNAAILAGLSLATGECAAFIAADLQDPPEALDEMISQWANGSKVVLAIRRDRKGDPFLTSLFARLFNFMFRHYIFHGYSPEGVGFFLLDHQVVEAVLNCEERNAHLIGLLLWLGFPFTYVQYDRIERKYGKSQWTFQKKLKYFIDAFAGYSYLPLRMASTIGLVLACFGGFYALVVLFLRLLGDVPVQGWSALMIVFLVVSGVQLVILGVIGEYLWRNLEASRKRPIYLIDHIYQMDNLHDKK